LIIEKEPHMPQSSILVTGAGGHLGRRVVELLLEREAGPVVAATRRPEGLADLAARGVEVRPADFDDPSGLARAFQGARRALLVSTDAVDRPGRRIAQHRTAVQAMAAAGVEHVVYTSLPNPVGSPIAIAPDHAGTEAALADTSLDFTILRNNMYAELLLWSLPGAIATGKLVDARGQGAVAYVTREDCARAAAAALMGAEPGRRTLDVTGPAALTGEDLAALTSELVSRPVTHVSVPLAALIEGMVQHGMPRAMAEIYATFDVAVAQGALAGVTDTVRRLTGREPQSVRDFLAANRAALVGPAA
jgi:NAD(P)H dehydrogenase (quinone)